MFIYIDFSLSNLRSGLFLLLLLQLGTQHARPPRLALDSGGILHKVGVWFPSFITCEFALSIYLRV